MSMYVYVFIFWYLYIACNKNVACCRFLEQSCMFVHIYERPDRRRHCCSRLATPFREIQSPQAAECEAALEEANTIEKKDTEASKGTPYTSIYKIPCILSDFSAKLAFSCYKLAYCSLTFLAAADDLPKDFGALLASLQTKMRELKAGQHWATG